MMNRPHQNKVTKSITVRANVDHAFQVWTEKIKLWWPTSHSLSGDPNTEVFIEGKIGGRFYERASNGKEYTWGVVIVWLPPRRLEFTWYLGSNQDLPTQVQVQFTPLANNQTRIDLQHYGPELIGDLWWQRNTRFNAAWTNILADFSHQVEINHE